MTVKMKARDLGLDDLRYDVDVTTARGSRVIGQLHRIERRYEASGISLWIGPAGALDEHVVHEGQTVTVDRDAERKSINHFASESKVLPC